MYGTKSLDNLFKERIFRIPDYQRGYAWQKDQLKDFWEDLINLSDDRSHYTGVLTFSQIKPNEVKEKDNEYWLIEDHSYNMYNIVDGQQRLTTFVVFLQGFIDFVQQLDENSGKTNQKIFITDSLSLEDIINKYLFKTKPTGGCYRTYKFGYTVDNPSDKYLRYKIFNEDGSPSIEHTFYTLNLRNAILYFYEQLKEFHAESGISGLKKIYKKLTKRFLFNEYMIEDEFDVFVAFETMNNRGRDLSNLELLKNRLIYLTTLYTDEELNVAERKDLRDAINAAYKEVYRQLGRNDKQPLNDDDFLKAHWIMYFQYSRKRGNDYIKFLLDEQFSLQKVHNKVELQPIEIKKYVNSLRESVKHWFNLHYPDLATELTDEEEQELYRLKRIGMRHFRPLVMSVLKNEKDKSKLVDFLNHVERFIFIIFCLSQSNGNYRDSAMYHAARKFNKNELTLDQIKEELDYATDYCFHKDGKYVSGYFLYRRRNNKNGYYGWSHLRYFLYEYELHLLSQSRQQKVSWEDLLKTPKDKISIEHIFSQTPTDSWKQSFASIKPQDYYLYSGSIGNLLLLSMSINSSLQNDDFDDKKKPKMDSAGNKIRNGYSDGSHSEIQVAEYDDWTPETIRERGMKLLTFMEKRWRFEFKDEESKEDLLFLKTKV